jgi:hypothetical protein
MADPLDHARTTPAPEQNNTRAVSHGARSERLVKPVATVQKRRLLRQIGLRQAQIDGIGLAYLDNWARAQAKVEVMDAYFAERGFLDGRGKPRPATAIYFTALNAARRAAERFAGHLKQHGVDPSAALAGYLERTYGNGEA